MVEKKNKRKERADASHLVGVDEWVVLLKVKGREVINIFKIIKLCRSKIASESFRD